MKEPTFPDVNRPSVQEAPILEERQRLVQSLLTEFSNTLDIFPDEFDDPVYRRQVGTVQANLELTPAQLAAATIEIKPKVIRPEDEPRTKRGEDPGMWISITHGNRVINLNIWGGIRSARISQDFHDSVAGRETGMAHTDQTDRVIDSPTWITANVQRGGFQSVDVQLILAGTSVQFNTLWLPTGPYRGSRKQVNIRDDKTPDGRYEKGTASYTTERLRKLSWPLLPYRTASPLRSKQ